MIKIILLFLVSVSLLTSDMFGKSLTVEPKRLVKINGDVVKSTNKVAQQIYNLSEKSSAPIYLYINSNGGRVDVTMNIVNAILIAQVKGIKIICVGHEKMYSAGILIFAWCSERYVLPFTQIMWHSVQIGFMGRLNEKMLTDTLEKALRDNHFLWKALRDRLDMPKEEYKKAFDDEKFWYAEDLAAGNPRLLTILKSVQGIKNLFYTEKGKKNGRNKVRRRKAPHGPNRSPVHKRTCPGNDRRSK